MKEILHLNKLSYFPQSNFQLSSTNELRRKPAFRNILLYPFEILSHSPRHENNPLTHPFFNSQLEINLHFRGCVTELVPHKVHSTAFPLF